MPLQTSESYVNLGRGVRFGDTDWADCYTDDLGELYRAARREFGRCTSKVYVDLPDGKVKQVGWCFLKRVEYEDAYRYGFCGEKTYLREVWVTYRQVPAAEGGI